MTNKEIIAFLSLHHNINIGLTTLKNYLNAAGLKRRQAEDDTNEIENAVAEETFASGGVLGTVNSIIIFSFSSLSTVYMFFTLLN